MMSADTLQFLLKVLALSAAIALVIKVVGLGVSLDGWDMAQLSPLALVIVVTPSLVVGAFLIYQWTR